MMIKSTSIVRRLAMCLSILSTVLLTGVVSAQTTETTTFAFTGGATAATACSNANVPTSGCTTAIGNSFGTVATPVANSSSSSGYTGFSGTYNIGNAVNNATTTFNSATSPYISVVIAPNVGYGVTITGISFGSRSTTTGASAYTISTSVGGFASAIGSGTLTANSSWALYTPTISSVSAGSGTAVTVRIYGYNGGSTASSGTINWRLDDIVVTYTLTPYSTNYYSLGGANNLNATATWGTALDGTGTHPTNFTTASQIFHVANSNTGTLSGSTWTVSGTSSKIVLDASTDLSIGAGTTISGTIDVGAGRTLTISSSALPTLGVLDTTSTIVYNGLSFTSTTLLPNTTSNTVTYGNLVLNNTTVAMPASAVDLTFRGNFTLSGNSSFIGGDSTSSTNGYNFITYGFANQTISGNGNLFYVRNFDINNTANSKGGLVTLAANTPMLVANSFRMNITGATNRFSDGGNTLKVFNNASMGGDALGYNLTGTLYMSATTASGNTNIRGYASGAAASTAAAVPVFKNITINNGTTSTVSFAPTTGAATYTIGGNLLIASTGTGALILNPNTINIGGNLTHLPSTSVLTTTNSTVVFNGASAQTYTPGVSGGLTFNNLTINSGNSLTLSGAMNVSGTLALTSGKIITGANTLSLASTGTVTGGSTTSYVNGNFLKAMPSGGVTSMVYQVGDATYAPLKLTFSSAIGSGSILVKSTTGSHPSISSSLIDATNAVNRYWTVTPTGVAPISINMDLSYNSADITGSGTNSGFIIRQYNGTSWSSAPAVTNSTSGTAPLLSNVTTTTGQSGTAYTGDYIVGNGICATPTGGTAIASATIICNSGSTTLSLTGASSNAAITYQWQSSADGTTYSNISGATSASYTASVTATTYYKCNVGCSLTGNTSLSTSVTVTITGAPTSVTASATASVCNGASLTLTGAATNATSYSWSGPGSYSSTSLNPVSFTVNTASAGIYTLVAANSCGSTTATTSSVTITDVPTSVSASSSPTTLCSGSSLTLTGSATNAISYSWSGPGSYSSTVQNPSAITVSTTSAGIYTLTATNSCGNTTATTSSVTVNSAPSPSISGSTAITVGGSATLTFSGNNGDIVYYSWGSGNASITIGSGGTATTSVSPSSATTYTIDSARATTGCFATITGQSAVITIDYGCTVAPTAVSAHLSAASICNGATLTITGAATNATSYSWSGPNGFTSTLLNPASFTVNTASAGIYTLTATNYCGSTTATTATFSISSFPSAVVATSSATTICSGSSLTLTGSATNAISYSWSGPNSYSSTDANPSSFTVNSASAGIYTLTATNYCGSTTITSSILSITTLPTSVTASISAATLCSGSSLTLTGSATNATSYSWSGPNSFTSTDQNPSSFTVNTASAGIYTLVASNTCGSTSATTTSVTITTSPTSVTATPSATSICSGSTLTLTGAATGATSFSWSGPNSFTSTLLNPASFTVNTASAGVYSLSATNACGSTVAATTSVTVNPLPTALISGTATIGSGSSTTLIFSGTASAVVYYWNGSSTVNTTLNSSGLSTVTVTPTITTTYSVTSVTSAAGCTQTLSGSTATVTVIAAAYISLTNAAPSYAQNFNTLPTNAANVAFTWTDNGTLAGWYASNTNSAYRIDNGSGTTGGVVSYGAFSATDRALGSLASGSTGTNYFGARFKNNGTTNIVALTVSYTGEQWRNGGNTTAQTYTVEYQIGATGITAGTWTGVPALSFTSLINTATAAALDGNATANRTAISSPISLTVAPGQEVWLRMTDLNDAGSDHGLSMDDLTVIATYAADYYSLGGSNNLNATATWGTNTDGTGSHPSNFTSPGQVFHVANGNTGSLSGSTWTVSGTGSKIVLDASTDLAIGSSTTITAIVDVAAGRTLTISGSTLPTLGTLDAASTIVYNGLSFTSTTLLPNTTSNAVTYGNVVLNNTTVAMPASAVDLTFKGNFTLSGTSSFIGGDSTSSTNGYNFITYGTADQTISGNGNVLYVRNFDINNTAGSKSGLVTLAANTPMLVANSFRMNITGAANRLSDGGNTLKVFNNASMGGDVTGYNLTGTLYMSATASSGNTNIRGYVSGAAASTVAGAPVFKNLIINNGTTSSVSFAPSTGGATYTISGNLLIASTGTGATVFNSNTINLGGNLTYLPASNTLTTTGSTLVFNGSSAQSYSPTSGSGITFNNVTINNASGLNLVGSMNMSGTLALTSGKIITGANILSLTSTSTITGGSVSSYVNGNLSRALPAAGVTSMAYQVGDATYAPVKLTFSSSLNSGSVMVKSISGSHPSIATSYIDASSVVNRYWTVTPTSVAPTTINIDLSYSTGDITGGGANTNFIIRQYNGTSWSTAPTITNSTSGASPLLANVTTTTGLSGSSFTGDYIAGNGMCDVPVAGTVVASSNVLCSAGTTTLSLTGASSGGAITYQWKSSVDGSVYSDVSGATSATYIPSVTATTYYKCNVGCLLSGTATLSSPVLITVGGTPTGVTASATPSVCNGSTLTLLGAAGTVSTYSWSGPNGFTSTDASPAPFIANSLSAGVYTMVATNSCGSATVTTVPVVITNAPSSISVNASSTTLCSGSLLSLTGSATYATSYSWSGPNSFTSTNQNPSSITVSSLSAGVYTLVASSTCGSISATTSNITINALPNPTISGTTVLPIGSSTTITFSGNNGDVVYYSWGSGNSSSTIGATGSSTVSVSPATTTTYTIDSARATTGCFALISGQSVTVTVDLGCTAPPTAVSANLSSVSLCSGSSLTLTGAATNGLSYSWSGPNGFTSTLLNPASFTVNSASAGVYTLTATNYCGSTVVTTAAFTVNTVPSGVSSTSSSSLLCVGNTISLNGSATGGTTYLWSGPNSFTSTNLNPASFTVGTASAGVYTLSVTNSCGTTTASTTSVVVNDIPQSVTVNTSATILCSGNTLTLTGTASAATSYSWSGPNSFTSTLLSPASFIVNTASAGVYTLVATNSCGSVTASTSGVVINTVPQTVSATASATTLCSGNTLTLTGAATAASSYSWSGPGSFTSTLLNPASFTVSTTSAGIYTLVATNSCGTVAATTSSVVVNSLPVVAAITGITTLNLAATTTLADVTSSGVWSSANAAIASVSATGVVTGVSLGASLISYTVTNGCGVTSVSTTVTVNPVVASSYAMWDFTGSTSGLASTSTSAAVPTSGCTSGIGNSFGTVATPIGATSVSNFSGASGTNNIGNAAAVGTFSSSTSAYIQFTLTPNTGYYLGLTGISFGSRSTSTGPQAYVVKSSIDGYSASLATGTLGNNSTWVLYTPTFTSVNGANNTPVTVRIYAYNGTGTASSGTVNWRIDDIKVSFTANPVPCSGTPAAGTVSGSTAFCGSGSTTLSFTPGTTASGVTYQWTSSNSTSSTFAPISGATNNTYITPTVTATTYYRVNTTCNYSSITSSTGNDTVTINPLPATPGAISGIASLCAGTSTTLTDTTSGGVWSTSNAAKASISSTGILTGVAAGTANITYTITNSCGSLYSVLPVIISPLPSAGGIVGSPTVCVGTGTLFTDTAVGGVWTSSDPSIATVSSSGLVNGVASGSVIISYAITNSCGTSYATSSVIINTSPSAGTISGPLSVCPGATVSLADGTAGGSWSSSDNTIATVNTSGTVTGVVSGNATISYTLTSSCGTAVATSPITVNSLPAIPVITGSSTVCQTATTTLFSVTSGGAWTSNNTAIATVDTLTGVVHGISGGSTTITYTVSNVCGSSYNTASISVLPLPVVGSISGLISVCVGSSISLSDTSSSGVWSISAPAIATISTSGFISGITAGTVTASYSVTNSCGTVTVTTPITVNAPPILPAITGTTIVSVGSTTTLSNSFAGGIWASSNSSIASVNTTGTVTGIGLGTALISYTATNTCGSATVTTGITVNPVVAASYAMWDFTGSTSGLASSSTSSVVPTSGCTSALGNSYGTVTTPINATSASSFSGASAGNNIGNAVATGVLSSSSAYVQFTLTPNAGYYLTITGVSFGSRSTSTGPQLYTIKSSADGYVSSLASGALPATSSWVLYTPSFTTVSGAYSSPVTVRIYGSNGTGSPATGTENWRLDDIKVNFNANPVPCSGIPAAGSIAGATAICGSGAATLTFSAGTTLSGTSYQWASTNDLSTSYAPIVGATSSVYSTPVLTDTTYYTVTTNCAYSGLSSTTSSAAVTINPLPVIGLTGTACAGNVITASGAAAYTWSPAAALSSSTGASVTPLASIPATVFTVIGSTLAGCISTDTITINATPTVAITASGSVVCGSGSQTLTALGADNYIWTPSVSLSATSGSVVIATPSSTTTYTVVGINNTGCTSMLLDTVTVSVSPAASITPGASPSVCQPTSSYALSYSSPAGSPTTYNIVWDATAHGGGFVDVLNASLPSSINLVIPTTGAPGTYSGLLTVSNGLCTSTAYPLTVGVYAHPAATITSANSPCVGGNTDIIINGTVGSTITYRIDSGSFLNGSIGASGIYSINTGTLTTPHNYTLTNAFNAVCTTVLDTVIYINPIPMAWVGGSLGHESEWNYAANWTCGFAPTVSDDATISAATYAPAIAVSDSGFARNLTLNAGSAILVNSNAVLNVKGTLTNNSNVNGTGKLVLNNTSAQLVKGIGTVNNLELNNAAGATIDTGSRLMIGKTLYVTSGTLTTNDSLELTSIDSNAARIAALPSSGASISGKVTADQYIVGGYRRFRFWSHPFSTSISLSQMQQFIDITGFGGSANGFYSTATNAPSAFRYSPYSSNDTLSYDTGWKAYTKINTAAADSNLFHSYQGIRLFFRGAKGEGILPSWSTYTPSAVTVKMSGLVNQGPQTVTLAQGSASPAHQSFNMVGNPYASPVDIGSVLFAAKTANQVTGSSFYVWNPRLPGGGNYVAVLMDGTPYYLPAFGAFQVQAHHNGATLNFAETNKGASSNNYLFKTPADYTVLNVYDGSNNMWDMLRIRFTDAATDNEDQDLDAVKIVTTDFKFYSLGADGRKLTIDARPYGSDKVIPLGIGSAYKQDFIIRADNVAVPAGGNLYLHDKLLNKTVEMKAGSEYKFTITDDKSTQGDNRFELALKPTVATVKPLSVTMTPNPTTDDVKISFTSGSNEEVSVRVMDMSGVSIYNTNLGVKQSGVVSVPLGSFASGVYMVELKQGNQIVTQRLIKE